MIIKYRSKHKEYNNVETLSRKLYFALIENYILTT